MIGYSFWTLSAMKPSNIFSDHLCLPCRVFDFWASHLTSHLSMFRGFLIFFFIFIISRTDTVQLDLTHHNILFIALPGLYIHFIHPSILIAIQFEYIINSFEISVCLFSFSWAYLSSAVLTEWSILLAKVTSSSIPFSSGHQCRWVHISHKMWLGGHHPLWSDRYFSKVLTVEGDPTFCLSNRHRPLPLSWILSICMMVRLWSSIPTAQGSFPDGISLNFWNPSAHQYFKWHRLHLVTFLSALLRGQQGGTAAHKCRFYYIIQLDNWVDPLVLLLYPSSPSQHRLLFASLLCASCSH